MLASAVQRSWNSKGSSRQDCLMSPVRLTCEVRTRYSRLRHSWLILALQVPFGDVLGDRRSSRSTSSPQSPCSSLRTAFRLRVRLRPQLFPPTGLSLSLSRSLSLSLLCFALGLGGWAVPTPCSVERPHPVMLKGWAWLYKGRFPGEAGAQFANTTHNHKSLSLSLFWL